MRDRRGRGCWQQGSLLGSLSVFSWRNWKRQCYLFFQEGIRAEQEFEGRSLVLRMLFGHGRQPVSRDLSEEERERERHLSSLTV